MHAITTLALQRSIAQLEQAGAHYTEVQLFYAACYTVLAPLRAALSKLRVAMTLPPPLSPTAVAGGLRHWIDRHGVPVGLLPANPSLISAAAPHTTTELDHYGLPQVLVCQDAAIAAMLRANAFDLELACPVFTVRDWPLSEAIIAALHRANRPRILVLHNASADGLALAGQLTATAPSAIPVQPIGLRPRHAKALRLCAYRRLPPPTLSALAMVDDEARWLQRGWQADVAAVYPIKLLRSLRAIVYATPQPISWRERWRYFVHSGFMSWPAWKEAV